jgi:DNA-binding NtrC family response regulator
VYFVGHFSEQLNVPSRKLTRGDVETLERYDWPGNIRELQNTIERALIRSRGGKLKFELGEGKQRPLQKSAVSRVPDDQSRVLTLSEIKDMERANIERALARCNGQVYGEDGAAALLGMKPTTLWSRLRSLGISTERP